jgi:hypothetical protein
VPISFFENPTVKKSLRTARHYWKYKEVFKSNKLMKAETIDVVQIAIHI